MSAGGTGTYDLNTWASEIQAGSYALMDSAYSRLGLPFRQAVFVLTTVISSSAVERSCRAQRRPEGFRDGQGQPDAVRCRSAVLRRRAPHLRPAAAGGRRLLATPAHVDPTVAYHDRMYVIDGDDVIEEWPVDLRGW